MKLGELILAYRSEHKLSQRQFAKKCGDISNGYVSMLENNLNPATNKGITPTIEKLKLIAGGMDMTLHELFEIVDDMPVSIGADPEFETGDDKKTVIENTKESEQRLSDKALFVARAFDSMSSYGKSIIMTVIDQERKNMIKLREVKVITSGHDSDVYARYNAKKELEELKQEESSSNVRVLD